MSTLGHRRQNPFFGGGGNSWMEFRTTRAHKKDFKCFPWGLSHLNLCPLIKPFKDGQIMSLATAVMALGISPTQWELKCCSRSFGESCEDSHVLGKSSLSRGQGRSGDHALTPQQSQNYRAFVEQDA